MTDYVYDIECYKNVLTVTFKNVLTGKIKTFEVSSRRNDFMELTTLLRRMQQRGDRMIGFNNFQYDWIVLRHLLNSVRTRSPASKICKIARDKSDEIFNATNDQRFHLTDWNPAIQQIDLMKIHHFDNKAKMTSLKLLEFNMGSTSIQDLPFDPNEPLEEHQIDELIEYNIHDVNETDRFRLYSLEAIRVREELSKKFNRNMMNFNDTKIGKQFYIDRIEKKLGKGFCERYDSNGEKKIRQTKRDVIELKDVMLPIEFETPAFQVLYRWLHGASIQGDKTKGGFKKIPVAGNLQLGNQVDPESIKIPKTTKKEKEQGVQKESYITHLNVRVNDFTFDIGAGGLHGCCPPGHIQSNEDMVIIDVDVDGYYPSLAISNGFHPEHLTVEFANVAKELKEERGLFKKGTPENKLFKLANNGTYGNSNSIFTPFFDPQYTMTITVNGQLLLCRLAELFFKIEGLKLIQANTDGLTVYIPRRAVSQLDLACSEWEFETGLDLEKAVYTDMYIRDVNNYIAVFEGDKSDKLKGAYAYDYINEGDQWHKNFSALVVQKVAHKHVKTGEPILDLLHQHDTLHDFMLRTKLTRREYKFITRDDEDNETPTGQGVNRYYVSNHGVELYKVMPPLAKKPDQIRYVAEQKGYKVTLKNTYRNEPLDDLNYDWYVAEVEKLVNPIIKKVEL